MNCTEACNGELGPDPAPIAEPSGRIVPAHHTSTFASLRNSQNYLPTMEHHIHRHRQGQVFRAPPTSSEEAKQRQRIFAPRPMLTMRLFPMAVVPRTRYTWLVLFILTTGALGIYSPGRTTRTNVLHPVEPCACLESQHGFLLRWNCLSRRNYLLLFVNIPKT